MSGTNDPDEFSERSIKRLVNVFKLIVDDINMEPINDSNIDVDLLKKQLDNCDSIDDFLKNI